MYAQVTALRYWKSEHNEQTCEDASNHDISRGIFAVADGVGTASFSNIWAKILVEEVVNKPLMSHDPFEVEWWLRSIFPIYEQRTPQIDQLPPLVQAKAREGSLSTLATLRMCDVDDDRAQAELLVFGDSCIIVADKASQQVTSFKLDNPLDFAKSPICVPSKLRAFDRDFNRCDTDSLTLTPNHIVILATDAVAKWILTQGNGRYDNQWKAFEYITAQTKQTWATFILHVREKNEIVDDDSTALIIRFSAEASEEYQKLGTTTSYDPEVKKERQKQLDDARRAQDREKVAILVGNQQTVGTDLPDSEVQRAREVADALRIVRQTLRMALQRNLNIPIKVAPVWQKHAHLLQNEPCAATIRNSLKQLGVILPVSQPVAPPQTTNTFKDDLHEATVTGIDEYRQKQSQKKRNHAEQSNPNTPIEVQRRFRHALASGDFKQIVAQYDPGFDGLLVVTDVERRILRASQDLESRYAQLLAVLGQDDEFKITEKYRAFKAFLREFVDSYESSEFKPPHFEPNKYLPDIHQQHLETALKQTEAYEQFQQAIEEEDDQKIVESYPFISSKHKKLITKEKRDQFQAATHRLNTLERFNEALESKNAQEILDSYRPILENYNKVQPEQRQRVERARHFVQMRQQIQQAIKNNDYAAILNAYDELLAAEFSDFMPAETERIELAKQKQREELAKFKEAFAANDDVKIRNCDHNLIAIAKEFSQEYRERYELAVKRFEALMAFQTALANDDDYRIVAAYDPILNGYSEITQKQMVRYEEAKERIEALKSWRVALDSGDDAQIVAVSSKPDSIPLSQVSEEDYTKIVDAYYRLWWTWSFRQAIENNNDNSDKRIVYLYEEYQKQLNESPPLSPDQDERYQSAKKARSLFGGWS